MYPEPRAIDGPSGTQPCIRRCPSSPPPARVPPGDRRRSDLALRLSAAVLGAMWILGVRDWRCLVLAVTSPVVVHGLWYGNLTVLLVLPLALGLALPRSCVGGRRRGRSGGRGEAFVWPLVAGSS